MEKADPATNDAYQCPMDRENGKTYDKGGKCPVCEMTLKKVEKEEQSESNHDGHNHDEESDEAKEGV